MVDLKRKKKNQKVLEKKRMNKRKKKRRRRIIECKKINSMYENYSLKVFKKLITNLKLLSLLFI